MITSERIEKLAKELDDLRNLKRKRWEHAADLRLGHAINHAVTVLGSQNPGLEARKLNSGSIELWRQGDHLQVSVDDRLVYDSELEIFVPGEWVERTFALDQIAGKNEEFKEAERLQSEVDELRALLAIPIEGESSAA